MSAEDDMARADEMLARLKAGQQERAKELQPGQCPGCGAYRRDGRPPLLHEHGCPWKGDAPLLGYYSV